MFVTAQRKDYWLRRIAQLSVLQTNWLSLIVALGWDKLPEPKTPAGIFRGYDYFGEASIGDAFQVNEPFSFYQVAGARLGHQLSFRILVVPLDENRIAPKRIASNDLNSDLTIHGNLDVPNGSLIHFIRRTISE